MNFLRLTIIIALIALATQASARSFVLDLSADGTKPGVFTDARTALRLMPDGTIDDPTMLIVRPGVYWLDDPDDPAVRRPAPGDGTVPYAATLAAKHLIIKAESADPKETIFAVNRGQTRGADGNYTMLKVTGTDIRVEGITLGNYCNVDLEYPRDPSQNRARRADAIVQAQIAICHGSDRMHFKNCRFVSRLNLCPFVGARRTLYEDCHFECTDDALCGTGIYVRCDFDFFSSKPFYSTSETGAIFFDCKIRSRVNGQQCLTKVGGPVTMIDTEIEGPDITELVWSRGDENYVCYTRGLRLNGQPAMIDPLRTWRTVDLTRSPALAAYVNADGTYNIGGLLSGDDGWNPTNDVSPTPRPTTHTIKIADGTLAHKVMRWGGWAAQAPAPESVRTTDTDWRDKTERIVREHDGLRATTTMRVVGAKRPAPTVSGPIKMMQMWKSGTMRISYTMAEAADADAEGQQDVSTVRWMRREADGSVTPVKESDKTGKETYKPTVADEGRQILVCVRPQRAATEPGEELWTEVTNNAPHQNWTGTETDFADVPVVHSANLKARGAWLMDAHKPHDTEYYEWVAKSEPTNPAWRFAKGFDGAAESIGLRTERRGARLTYNAPVDACHGMTLEMDIDPCKPAGQGFGSATGQYLDVVVAFDIATGRGLGLRIERTPDYDKAVAVSLIRYAEDGSEKLTEPQRCDIFRPGFSVSVSLDAESLSATMRNNGAEQKLSVPTSATSFTPGVRVQHTGTVGGGGLVIRHAKITITEK